MSFNNLAKPMITTRFNVSAKKGDSQPTRWLIVQSRPHPGIHSGGSRLEWQNDDGKLWDRYQRPATGLDKVYYCYLLADTCPEVLPEDYNRTLFAGYQDYRDRSKVNGGQISFRGQLLGECIVIVEPHYTQIRVTDGHTPAAPSVRQFFDDQIVPQLKETISQTSIKLHNYAANAVKKRLYAELEEKRKELDDLAKQIETAKFI